MKRSYTRRNRRRKWAKGRKALAICDRTGFQHRMKDMVIEPGTGLLVYKTWSDGKWNRVDHPQNFPPAGGESIGIKNARPDRVEPTGEFIITANDEYLIANGMVVFK